ncbi:hypothetical protein [Aeromonas rivipollensis]
MAASSPNGNGSLSFQVPAYSARVWVLGGPGKVGWTASTSNKERL